MDIGFEGLGEMFEGVTADTSTEKFPLVSMGGRAEGLACTDPGARTPIGASGIMIIFVHIKVWGRINITETEYVLWFHFQLYLLE